MAVVLEPDGLMGHLQINCQPRMSSDARASCTLSPIGPVNIGSFMLPAGDNVAWYTVSHLSGHKKSPWTASKGL